MKKALPPYFFESLGSHSCFKKANKIRDGIIRAIESRFLLAALVFFLSTATGYTADNPNVPSRQATLVLPILSQFSPVDRSKGDVMDDLKRILGKPDFHTEGGPTDHAWQIYRYRLDDDSIVLVEFKENSDSDSMDLAMISYVSLNGKIRELYVAR